MSSVKKQQNYQLYFCLLDAIADDTVRYQYVKKKGYVRLHTNKGDLNLELHCDKVTDNIHIYTLGIKSSAKQSGEVTLELKNASRTSV